MNVIAVVIQHFPELQVGCVIAFPLCYSILRHCGTLAWRISGGSRRSGDEDILTLKLAGLPSHFRHYMLPKAVCDPRLLSDEHTDFGSCYLLQLGDDLQRARATPYHGNLFIAEIIAAVVSDFGFCD